VLPEPATHEPTVSATIAGTVVGLPQLAARVRALSRADLAAIVATVLFVGASLVGLDTLPPVHQDEPWIAAPGYSFWTTGRFATPLFAGYYGSETRYFGFMPLFPMLVGLSLRLFGLGLFQVRLVSVLCAAATLLLTHLVARRLFSAAHGALAVVFLVVMRLAVPSAAHPLGIPLADLARVARYDIAVPVFGLAALLVLLGNDAARVPTLGRAGAAGLLCGAATLCHAYGPVWLVVCAAAACHGGARALASLLGGFLAALAPWVAWAARHVDDFRSQHQLHASRFQFWEPRFYLDNLVHERSRYAPFARALLSGQPPVLLFGAAAVLGALLVARGARRGDRASAVFLAVLVAPPVLFALLLSTKTVSYTATLWPAAALAAAVGALAVWESRRGRGAKALAAAVLAIASCGGLRAWVDLRARAQEATSYPALCDRLARALPPHSRLLGFQHYWLGLAGRVADYRSIVVPLRLSDAQQTRPPRAFAAAAEEGRPDVVLLDPVLLRFLDEARPEGDRGHAMAADFSSWLASRNPRLRDAFVDPSYGRFEVWTLGP
jgi:4-amino-4-deoxy-L-arabinose transferase-like glycosyltransferase